MYQSNNLYRYLYLQTINNNKTENMILKIIKIIHLVIDVSIIDIDTINVKNVTKGF